MVLCLDNDEAGEKASLRIAKELREIGVTDVRRLSSIYKDWNEDLTTMYNNVMTSLVMKEGAAWDQSMA